MEMTRKDGESEELTEMKVTCDLSDREFDFDSSTFDFTQKSWSSDIILVVEGSKLFVAKNILALASPVFYRMFQSGFQESAKDELDLPGKKKAEVIELLRCIYPNSLTEVSHETALKILPLVEEYQVMHVKTRCEKALLGFLDNVSNHTPKWLCKLLKEACLYDLKELRAKCVNLASEKSQEELESAYKIFPLPADAENEILVKVNRTLRNKLADLQKSNTAMKEEIKPLKDYFICGFNPDERFPIADGRTWKKEALLFIIEVDKMEAYSKKSTKIWDSLVYITAKPKLIPSQKRCFSSEIVQEQWLHFEITIQTFSTQAKYHNLYLRFVLLDRISKTENLPFIFRKELNGNHVSMKLELKKLSFLKKNYARDGKLALLVQIYLSEPK